MKLVLALLAIAGPAAFADETPVAAASAATMPAPPPAAEAKAPSDGVKVDIGNAKLNLLLQMWYADDSTSTSAKNNFRARRAETKLSGNLNPDARWFLMFDPAKSLKTGAVVATNDNKVLQDLGLAYVPAAGFEITAGQFKIPTTAEGLDSSGDLPLPERSIVARTYGDKRQLGVQGSYKEKAWKLTAMYSNSGNANTDDTTTAKDINVRLDVTPFTGFSLGGWVGAGDFSFGDNGRWGLNLRWKGDRELARFELAHADTTTGTTKVKTDGYVTEVGYSVLSSLQPVLRFERYFPNSMSDASAQATTLGANYFLAKNNQKLQAAYSWTNHVAGGVGSYVADMGIEKGRAIVVTFQMAI